MATNGSDSGVISAIDTTAEAVTEQQQDELNPLEVLMQVAAAAQAEPEPEPEEIEYGDLPMSEAEYMAQQGKFSPFIKNAVDLYVYPHKTNGTLYSPSQQVNNALRKDLPVPAMYQSMVDGMDAAMHELGYNATLTRYDRVGFLQRLLGGKTHEGMTEKQLRDKLIGVSYKDKALVSTSHNDFKNAPPGNPFKDKTVELRIKAKAGTKAMMPGKGPGGDLGEIVLGRNQWFKITDVKMPKGVKGRSGNKWYQKVIIEVEVG